MNDASFSFWLRPPAGRRRTAVDVLARQMFAAGVSDFRYNRRCLEAPAAETRRLFRLAAGAYSQKGNADALG